MADPEQVALLKKSVKTWNARRGSLTNPNLSRAELSGANLSGAVLWGATLDEVNFGNTIFADVDLTETSGLESCTHFERRGCEHVRRFASLLRFPPKTEGSGDRRTGAR